MDVSVLTPWRLNKYEEKKIKQKKERKKYVVRLTKIEQEHGPFYPRGCKPVRRKARVTRDEEERGELRD